MPFELRIALRYLMARRKQAFVSLISAISVLGVAVGVAALLIALALMTGLQGEIRKRILGATAHMSLFQRGGEPFEEYEQALVKLRGVPHVLGAAPAFYTKGLMSSAAASAFVTLKGIVPDQERTVTELGRQVERGSLDALAAEGEDGLAPMLLGHDLAASLGVDVGDVVSVTSPRGRLTPLGVLPRTVKLKVAGVVKSGLYEFDSAWAYLPLASAQRHFGEGQEVSLIELRLDDMYAVRDLSAGILKAMGDEYVATDWIQMNGSLFSALKLEKTVIGMTIGLIVMVAALNIVATLILMVMEKHKDIAILVSMGVSPLSAMGIFVLQGSIIGAIGTSVGALLGAVVCEVFDRYRLIQLPADIYQVQHVPFTLLPWDATLVVLGALVICFLSTIVPSLGAAFLDPAEALRYE